MSPAKGIIKQRSGRAKLSLDQVAVIREAPRTVSNASLAKFYGVSKVMISLIRTRKSWVWL